MNKKLLLALAVTPAFFAPATLAQDAKPKPATADQPVLLGQYGDWGAYKASPGGKTVCFALAKPVNAVLEPAGRKRDQSYLFISTRPSEKVKNEISAIVGYKQKAAVDTIATIGAAQYAMYSQGDGAWIKNVTEEAQVIDAMRKNTEIIVRATSINNAKSTDTYTLKGLAQALDKVSEECK